MSCSGVNFLIDVSLSTIFQLFDFLTCSPSSQWIPNKLPIAPYCIPYTICLVFYYCNILLSKYTWCIRIDNNLSILVSSKVSKNLGADMIDWYIQSTLYHIYNVTLLNLTHVKAFQTTHNYSILIKCIITFFIHRQWALIYFCKPCKYLL